MIPGRGIITIVLFISTASKKRRNFLSYIFYFSYFFISILPPNHRFGNVFYILFNVLFLNFIFIFPPNHRFGMYSIFILYYITPNHRFGKAIIIIFILFPTPNHRFGYVLFIIILPRITDSGMFLSYFYSSPNH